MKIRMIGLMAWLWTGLVWAEGNVANDLNLVGVIGGETNPQEAIAVIKEGGRTLFLQMGDSVRSNGLSYKITKIAGKTVTLNSPTRGTLTVITRAQEESPASDVLSAYANYNDMGEDSDDDSFSSDEVPMSSVLSAGESSGEMRSSTGEFPMNGPGRASKRFKIERVTGDDATEMIEQMRNQAAKSSRETDPNNTHW